MLEMFFLSYDYKSSHRAIIWIFGWTITLICGVNQAILGWFSPEVIDFDFEPGIFVISTNGWEGGCLGTLFENNLFFFFSPTIPFGDD